MGENTVGSVNDQKRVIFIANNLQLAGGTFASQMIQVNYDYTLAEKQRVSALA